MTSPTTPARSNLPAVRAMAIITSTLATVTLLCVTYAVACIH